MPQTNAGIYYKTLANLILNFKQTPLCIIKFGNMFVGFIEKMHANNARNKQYQPNNAITKFQH